VQERDTPPCCESAFMFAFYSNRVGCLGSIVISLILSVILFAVMAMLSGRL